MSDLDNLTEDQHENLELNLHDHVDAFWLEFSELVARFINLAPAEVADELLMRMQEHASVYGSRYDDHLVTGNLRPSLKSWTDQYFQEPT